MIDERRKHQQYQYSNLDAQQNNNHMMVQRNPTKSILIKTSTTTTKSQSSTEKRQRRGNNNKVVQFDTSVIMEQEKENMMMLSCRGGHHEEHQQQQQQQQHRQQQQQQGPLTFHPKEEGGWQDDAYIHKRLKIITRISQILRHMSRCSNNNKPVDQNRFDKLMNTARKLELVLYCTSSSYEEYIDASTLKDRVEQTVSELKKQRKIGNQNNINGKQQQQLLNNNNTSTNNNNTRTKKAEKYQLRGTKYIKCGNYIEAKHCYTKALEIYYIIYGTNAANDFIARSLHSLGIVEHRLNHNLKSYEYCTKALIIYNRLYGKQGSHNNKNMAKIIQLLETLTTKHNTSQLAATGKVTSRSSSSNDNDDDKTIVCNNNNNTKASTTVGDGRTMITDLQKVISPQTPPPCLFCI